MKKMKLILLFIILLTCLPLCNLRFYQASAQGIFDDTLMASQVAAVVGTFSIQISSFQEAFGNMDMAVIGVRSNDGSSHYSSLHIGEDGLAETGDLPGVFSPLNLPELKKGIWSRTYTIFEDVVLTSPDIPVPIISDTIYGNYFGIDSPLTLIKHNFLRVLSAYGAFNGSHQNYDNVGIYQEGGAAGVTSAFYKGDFYSGLTTNVSGTHAHASTEPGRENFTILSTGIASKTGYNWEVANRKFIIQPYWFMAYGYLQIFDHTNAEGAKITSKPLNRIFFAPGIKFVANLKRSFQPYARVDVIWSEISGDNFYADGVRLPSLSGTPVVQYGGGIQKRFDEKATYFFQAIARGGSRNGVGLTFGLRWVF